MRRYIVQTWLISLCVAAALVLCVSGVPVSEQLPRNDGISAQQGQCGAMAIVIIDPRCGKRRSRYYRSPKLEGLEG
jgi:hypothetical protein